MWTQNIRTKYITILLTKSKFEWVISTYSHKLVILNLTRLFSLNAFLLDVLLQFLSRCISPNTNILATVFCIFRRNPRTSRVQLYYRKIHLQQNTKFVTVTETLKKSLPLHLGLTQHCALSKYVTRDLGTSDSSKSNRHVFTVLAASSKRDVGLYVISLTNRTIKGFSRKLNWKYTISQITYPVLFSLLTSVRFLRVTISGGNTLILFLCRESVFSWCKLAMDDGRLSM